MESQFHWYIHETKLELSEAVALAQEFKIAVLASLNFLLKNPGMGRKRFPQFPDLAGTRSWRVNPPFNRFLIYTITWTTDNYWLIALSKGIGESPPTRTEKFISTLSLDGSMQ